MQWCDVRSQQRFSISHKLCFICIWRVDPQNLIISHMQTPYTPGNPINVYSGSKTQLWSSHLPQLLCPTFDPQGLADSCCVASTHVKAKSSRNRFYQCSDPVGHQRLLSVIILAKAFCFLCEDVILTTPKIRPFSNIKDQQNTIWQKHLSC